MQHSTIIPAARHGASHATDGSELARTVTRLRGYDAIAATIDHARIQLGRDRALANGGAYMMTYDDFVDRFGYPIAVVTDSEGTRHAHHKIASWPLDTALCSGCDNLLPLTAYCASCDEDMSK